MQTTYSILSLQKLRQRSITLFLLKTLSRNLCAAGVSDMGHGLTPSHSGSFNDMASSRTLGPPDLNGYRDSLAGKV